MGRELAKLEVRVERLAGICAQTAWSKISKSGRSGEMI
jgi:hypothetical protein